jgi:coenzyme F420-reducing hydrogenase gamma subunit
MANFLFNQQISRRSFLKSLTLTILPTFSPSQIKEILSKPTILWAAGSACSGDIIAFSDYHTQDEEGNITSTLADILELIDLRYCTTLTDTRELPPYVDIAFVSGASSRNIAFAPEKTINLNIDTYMKEVRAHARYVIAVGTCAVFGGVFGKHSETYPILKQGIVFDGRGMRKVNNPDGVIECDLGVTGCPPKAEHIVNAAVALLKGIKFSNPHQNCQIHIDGCPRSYDVQPSGPDEHFKCLKPYGCKLPWEGWDCYQYAGVGPTRKECEEAYQGIYTREGSPCSNMGDICIGCHRENFPEEKLYTKELFK